MSRCLEEQRRERQRESEPEPNACGDFKIVANLIFRPVRVAHYQHIADIETDDDVLVRVELNDSAQIHSELCRRAGGVSEV